MKSFYKFNLYNMLPSYGQHTVGDSIVFFVLGQLHDYSHYSRERVFLC